MFQPTMATFGFALSIYISVLHPFPHLLDKTHVPDDLVILRMVTVNKFPKLNFCFQEPLEGGLHTGSDADKGDYSPPGGLYIRGREPLVKSGAEHDPLKKLRVGRKDRKKAGDGLRGKNVTEAFRVKEKDLKRTMK